MKQRHSFTNLVYHLVFRTKEREPFIESAEDDDTLLEFMKTKASQLETQVLEFGGWYDHVHLLIRARPTMALSEVYRQLKGFSSHSWNKSTPERPFGWADGVWAVTVDAEHCDTLRKYIRNQRIAHRQREEVAAWEPEPSPPGLAEGQPDRGLPARGRGV